jgi:RNA polymerase sigma factor (TIGR02999 family)
LAFTYLLRRVAQNTVMFSEQTSLRDRSLDERFSLAYEELCRIASRLRHAEAHATIVSAALVDEAWAKLKDSPQLAQTTTGHFKAIAANAMRQVLVEEARRRNAQKRGGDVMFLTLGEDHRHVVPVDVAVLDLDAALDELEGMSPRQARIVESLFFGGMTVSELAETLDVSESLIERDWRAARAWLAARIRPAKE